MFNIIKNLKKNRKTITLNVSHDTLKMYLHYDPLAGIFTGKYNTHLIGKTAGCANPKGYIRIKLLGKFYNAHRLAWFYMTGEWPEHQIDHKDVNPSNNKWSNLREATNQQNNCNKSLQSNNKSGFKGVCYDKNRNKWMMTIKVNRKIVKQARYDSIEDAAYAYKVYSERLHKEFARVN